MDERTTPEPDWPPLTFLDRVELEITALYVQYDHLRHEVDDLAVRVAEIEAQRAMDEQD